MERPASEASGYISLGISLGMQTRLPVTSSEVEMKTVDTYVHGLP